MAKKPTPITPDANVFDPEGTPVRLGQQTYALREAPIGRLKQFRTAWLDFFSRLTTLSRTDLSSEDAVDAAFDLLENGSADLIAILVPTLDRDAFLDPDAGATIPQLKAAFETALEVNGLEALKKAVPFLLEQMRMAAQQTRLSALREAAEKAQAALTAAAERTESPTEAS